MCKIEDAGEFNSMELAAEIVAAFVLHNSLPMAELPRLIASVDAALRGLIGCIPTAEQTEKPTPAVPMKKSITPDLICLEDGNKFKSLKRHFAVLRMTPDEYRVKWGLPSHYPIVAANCAAKRSDLTTSIRRGQARKTGDIIGSSTT